MAAKAVFVDTSVIIAAYVAEHPSHQEATSIVQKLLAERVPLFCSPQVCREILVVLTRQPVSGRVFSTHEALEVVDEWRRASNLLVEDEASVRMLNTLIRRHAVRGK